MKNATMSSGLTRRQKCATVVGFSIITLLLICIQAGVEAAVDWFAPGRMIGLYGCIAFGSLWLLPYLACFERWSRPLYVVGVLLMTIPWSFPGQRTAFCMRTHTLRAGNDVKQVEAAMQPYWERSRHFDTPPLPAMPLAPDFTGTLYFTYEKGAYGDFAVITLRGGTVTDVRVNLN